MDKQKAIGKGKKAVSAYFKVRRWIKIYTAFATGVLSGIYTYRYVYELTEKKLYSAAMALLCAAFVTTMMLLIIELLRILVSKLKKLGIKIYEKLKSRKEEKVDV